MIIGLDNFLAAVKLQITNFPTVFWDIYKLGDTRNGRTTFSSSNRTTGLTPSQAFEELQHIVCYLGRGQFEFAMSDKEKSTVQRGSQIIQFEIPIGYNNSSQNNNNFPAAIGATNETIQELIQKAIAEHEQKKIIEEIKEENKELKQQHKTWEKEKNSAIGKLMEVAVQYLPEVKPITDRAMAAIGKIPGESEVQETDLNYDDRVNNCLEGLHTYDPDWLTTLERIVKLTKKKEQQDGKEAAIAFMDGLKNLLTMQGV